MNDGAAQQGVGAAPPAGPRLPLLTPSLRLRHFTAVDAPLAMALNAEPSTRHWLPSHVYASLDDAVARLSYLIACCTTPGDPRLGPYVLAVEQRATGRLLGHVGFSPLGAEVEVSYAIAEAARGRGHGAEALRHACAWAAGAFALPSIVAITATANAASRRTLERACFAFEADAVLRFQGTQQAVSRYRWTASPDAGGRG